MFCPRCKQGVICRVHIQGLDAVTFLCDECDAMWLSQEDIGPTTFQDFSLFMQGRGFKGTWDELMLVEEDWEQV